MNDYTKEMHKVCTNKYSTFDRNGRQCKQFTIPHSSLLYIHKYIVTCNITIIINITNI